MVVEAQDEFIACDCLLPWHALSCNVIRERKGLIAQGTAQVHKASHKLARWYAPSSFVLAPSQLWSLTNFIFWILHCSRYISAYVVTDDKWHRARAVLPCWHQLDVHNCRKLQIRRNHCLHLPDSVRCVASCCIVPLYRESKLRALLIFFEKLNVWIAQKEILN